MNTEICYDCDEELIWNGVDQEYLELDGAKSFLEDLKQAVADMENAISEMSKSPLSKQSSSDNPDGHYDD